MADLIGALDQGTTSTRFMVFDRCGRVMVSAQQEHEQIDPKPGWVEHRPREIWQRTLEVIEQACTTQGLHAGELACLGIANQRETTVVWDRPTGEPVCNAFVWQDTRVSEHVASFAREGGQDRFRAKTGLPLTTYFSGLQIRWMVSNPLLMQFQADLLGRKVIRPAMKETTALGAAYAAGLACGVYRDTHDPASNWSIDQTWEPRIGAGEREDLLRQWKKAVARSFDWVDAGMTRLFVGELIAEAVAMASSLRWATPFQRCTTCTIQARTDSRTGAYVSHGNSP